MRRTMIACSMMEDEIRAAMAELQIDIPIVWMDRGLHADPELLRAKIQKEIDNLSDMDEILLCYGLCGNGTDGLVSAHSRLIIPRFDDCINMMLCTGKRQGRGLVEPGVMYISKGWTQDEKMSVLGIYDSLREQLGDDEEMIQEVIDMMYANYRSIALLDTGCYDIEPVQEYVDSCADLLGLETDVVPGSNRIMKELLSGEYDRNFIVLEVGETLSYSHFNY